MSLVMNAVADIIAAQPSAESENQPQKSRHVDMCPVFGEDASSAGIATLSALRIVASRPAYRHIATANSLHCTLSGMNGSMASE